MTGRTNASVGGGAKVYETTFYTSTALNEVTFNNLPFKPNEVEIIFNDRTNMKSLRNKSAIMTIQMKENENGLIVINTSNDDLGALLIGELDCRRMTCGSNYLTLDLSAHYSDYKDVTGWGDISSFYYTNVTYKVLIFGE